MILPENCSAPYPKNRLEGFPFLNSGKFRRILLLGSLGGLNGLMKRRQQRRPPFLRSAALLPQYADKPQSLERRETLRYLYRPKIANPKSKGPRQQRCLAWLPSLLTWSRAESTRSRA